MKQNAAAAKSLQLCPTVQLHRRQPTRLQHPRDSPDKNTGVGCHFLLQSMKVKSQSEVAQSCLTLRDPMDCSLPGFSIHGICQARVMEWGATAFSDEPKWVETKKKKFSKIPASISALNEEKRNFNVKSQVPKGLVEVNNKGCISIRDSQFW